MLSFKIEIRYKIEKMYEINGKTVPNGISIRSCMILSWTGFTVCLFYCSVYSF